MPRCIYCLCEGPASEFNTEHVMPAAFGVFDNGLTLSRPRHFRVCSRCNQKLGDELDLSFAGESWEGMLRITRHPTLGDPMKQKHDRVEIWLPSTHPMAPMRLRVTRKEGFPGMFCTAVSQLRLTFESGAKKCIEEGQIAATIPELLAVEGQPTGVEMFYSSEDRRAVERLVAKGKAAGIASIKWLLGAETGSDNVELVDARLSFSIDTLVARAMSKIAFEYFVWNVGENLPGLINEDLLTPIRDLIVDAAGDWRALVVPTNEPILADETRTMRHGGCHLLSMVWEGRGVVVSVALFNDIVYKVKVCNPPSRIYVDIRAGHHFDLDARSVNTLVTSAWLLPPPTVRRIVEPP